jgi:hypothetical protein
MSTAVKIIISAIGVGAMLTAPAMAKTKHHPPAHHRAYSGAYGAGPNGAGAYGGFIPNDDYSTPRTGYKYFGPYNERLVTMPNGTVLGTDPDPSIRAYMRRDGIGPNGNRGVGMSR